VYLRRTAYLPIDITLQADAARGRLKEIYAPIDAAGKERKLTLQPYPSIPWVEVR
jgi:hypothetical protein